MTLFLGRKTKLNSCLVGSKMFLINVRLGAEIIITTTPLRLSTNSAASVINQRKLGAMEKDTVEMG